MVAPIDIANEKNYMGIMLQRDNQNQQLYLHDAVIEKEIDLSTEDDLNATRSSEEKTISL